MWKEAAGVRRKRVPAREEQIIRACEIVYDDSDVLAIEREWEALMDDKNRDDEPWNDNTSTR